MDDVVYWRDGVALHRDERLDDYAAQLHTDGDWLMAMAFYKGVFTANTGTGNQTVSGIVDENGASFTPKAVMLWSAYLTSSAFTDGYLFQQGLTDGTNQNSTVVLSTDNASPNVSRVTTNITSLVTIINSAGTATRVGTFVSFSSGQFVINWTTADGLAPKFHFIAFGGTSLSASVGSLSMVGPASVPTLAFQPSCLIMMHNATTGTGAPGPQMSFASYLDGTQALASNSLLTGQTTSSAFRYERTTRAASLLNGANGAAFAEYGFGYLGLVQFTQPTAASALNYLALGGVNATVGSGLQPTTTGNQSVTGKSFTPKGLMMASIGNVAVTTIQHNGSALSFGAADATRQGWDWTGATNGMSPSVTAT